MTTPYLSKAVGQPLTQCLAELTEKSPKDPIEWIAQWLYRYIDRELYFFEKAIFLKDLHRMRLELQRENAIRQGAINTINSQVDSLKKETKEDSDAMADLLLKKISEDQSDGGTAKKHSSKKDSKGSKGSGSSRLEDHDRLALELLARELGLSPSQLTPEYLAAHPELLSKLNEYKNMSVEDQLGQLGYTESEVNAAVKKMEKKKKDYGFWQDADGNWRDKDGNLIDAEGLWRDADGNWRDANGRKVGPDGQPIDGEEGGLIKDENGQWRTMSGRLVDEDVITRTSSGRLVDLSGRLVDSSGRLVDSSGRLVDEDGISRTPSGRIISDARSVLQSKKDRLLDPSKEGYWKDENGQWRDKDGNLVSDAMAAKLTAADARISEELNRLAATCTWSLDCNLGLVCAHSILGQLKARCAVVKYDTPEWWAEMEFSLNELYDHEIYTTDFEDHPVSPTISDSELSHDET